MPNNTIGPKIVPRRLYIREDGVHCTTHHTLVAIIGHILHLSWLALPPDTSSPLSATLANVSTFNHEWGCSTSQHHHHSSVTHANHAQALAWDHHVHLSPIAVNITYILCKCTLLFDATWPVIFKSLSLHKWQVFSVSISCIYVSNILVS